MISIIGFPRPVRARILSVDSTIRVPCLGHHKPGLWPGSQTQYSLVKSSGPQGPLSSRSCGSARDTGSCIVRIMVTQMGKIAGWSWLESPHMRVLLDVVDSNRAPERTSDVDFYGRRLCRADVRRHA